MIGDQVNAAARIQALTREDNNQNRILIGEQTFEYVNSIVGNSYRELGSRKVKEKVLQVYEIFGIQNGGE